MKKDNFTITLDKLNAIIPIFAAEFCDMNDGEDEDLIMGVAAYIFVNVEKYIRGERDVGTSCSVNYSVKDMGYIQRGQRKLCKVRLAEENQVH